MNDRTIVSLTDRLRGLSAKNMSVTKHALLIPFHFPPIQGSTGALRSLAFAKWLPDFGWRSTVLTVAVEAYPRTTAENTAMIPPHVNVTRAFARDAQRHFSVRGRYPRFLALPDRWSSWVIGGVLAGLRICRNDRPNVLYSTYPTPSSHLIGLVLHKLTGIPWVAEFRDPMVEEGYPPVVTERSVRQWIEKQIFKRASRIVVVTESARRLYQQRAGRGSEFVVNIPNGFDESETDNASQRPLRASSGERAAFVLLHSGVLYPGERNPEPLLRALAELRVAGELESAVKFVFRGAGNEHAYRALVEQLSLQALVEFRDSISYAAARAEMRDADALMVLQGAVCNRQIPAKVYEYLAAAKPILCLADPAGDTAQLFRSLGLAADTALEDVGALQTAVKRFLADLRAGSVAVVRSEAIQSMSRRGRTKDLAVLLNEACAEYAAPD